MHFVLQTPSLQHLAAVKIVADIWNQRDISTQIIAPSFHGIRRSLTREEAKNWKAIEEKVESKVLALSLPETCKKYLLTFIKPLGMEIIIWCRYHSGEWDNLQILDILLGNPLCWTMRGAVDYAKTAELMVKDERVDVERRYEAACLNCLEDEARKLISFIPEERIQEYFDSEILIIYFTDTLTGRGLDHLTECFEFMPPALLRKSNLEIVFEEMLSCSNRATCEYFLKKLSQREKEQFIEEFERVIESCTGFPTSNMLFYWSLLNEEQQGRLFEKFAGVVLKYLLRWPRQSLFMEAAQCGWQLMNGVDCADVLNAIIFKICRGYRDYDYAQLFRECWRLSSAEHKQHFQSNILNLVSLIQTKEEEFVKLVLNEASSHKLKELVESSYDEISAVLMDESAISVAALMECKEKAALNSSNDNEDVEKRLRSEYVSRLVDTAMKSREIVFR